jgi:hypothetical protein
VTLQNFQAWWKRTHDSSKFELSDAMKAIASAPVVDAELVGDAEQSKPETLALPTALGVGQLPQRVSQTSPMADHHAAMRLRHQTMPPTTLHHQTPPQQAPQSVPAPAPLQQLRVTIPYGVTSGAPGFSIHCVNSCANALVLMWRRGFPCSRLDPVAVCIIMSKLRGFNHWSGMMINVHAPNGAHLQCRVPPGMVTGQQMLVNMPPGPPPATTAISHHQQQPSSLPQPQLASRPQQVWGP